MPFVFCLLILTSKCTTKTIAVDAVIVVVQTPVRDVMKTTKKADETKYTKKSFRICVCSDRDVGGGRWSEKCVWGVGRWWAPQTTSSS